MPLSHLATLRGGCDLRDNKEPGTDHGPTVSQALFYILVYHYHLSPLPYLIDAENESEREAGPYWRTKARKQQAHLTLGKPEFFFPRHWAGCLVVSQSSTQRVLVFRTFDLTNVCCNLCPRISDRMYVISVISRISFVWSRIAGSKDRCLGNFESHCQITCSLLNFSVHFIHSYIEWIMGL